MVLHRPDSTAKEKCKLTSVVSNTVTLVGQVDSTQLEAHKSRTTLLAQVELREKSVDILHPISENTEFRDTQEIGYPSGH